MERVCAIVYMSNDTEPVHRTPFIEVYSLRLFVISTVIPTTHFIIHFLFTPQRITLSRL